MAEQIVYCYVASQAGMPGYCSITVDEPRHKKHNAKFVADRIKEGLAVTRVSLEEARAGILLYMGERKRLQLGKKGE